MTQNDDLFRLSAKDDAILIVRHVNIDKKLTEAKYRHEIFRNTLVIIDATFVIFKGFSVGNLYSTFLKGNCT